MAEGVVTQLTAAPKKAFSFAEHNLLAFLLLAVLLMVMFVAIEVRKPGGVIKKVSKLPFGIGAAVMKQTPEQNKAFNAAA